MKMKKELQVGLLLFGITMLLKHVFPVPELLMGALLGLSLCLELVGSLSDEYYERLKQAKKHIFGRNGR